MPNSRNTSGHQIQLEKIRQTFPAGENYFLNLEELIMECSRANGIYELSRRPGDCGLLVGIFQKFWWRIRAKIFFDGSERKRVRSSQAVNPLFKKNSAEILYQFNLTVRLEMMGLKYFLLRLINFKRRATVLTGVISKL